MADLIERFGGDNLLILLVLLVVIILITIVAFVAENKAKKKEIVIENKITEEQLEKIVEDRVEELVNVEDEIITEQEDAKIQLEQLKEELKEPKEEISGPTDFEIEQEKTAIINYEELKKASLNISEKDEKLLDDEGNEPISFDDLYQQQTDKKVELMDFIDKKEEQDNIDAYETKFISSDVISPVFGTREHKNMVNEIKECEFKTSLEIEIAKTEKFLRELKELKKKLDQS